RHAPLTPSPPLNLSPPLSLFHSLTHSPGQPFFERAELPVQFLQHAVLHRRNVLRVVRHRRRLPRAQTLLVRPRLGLRVPALQQLVLLLQLRDRVALRARLRQQLAKHLQVDRPLRVPRRLRRRRLRRRGGFDRWNEHQRVVRPGLNRHFRSCHGLRVDVIHRASRRISCRDRRRHVRHHRALRR
ncbi:unnamed protein product, partial [Closterium sp. NIES-54]